MNPNVYTALGKTRGVGCVGCLGTVTEPYGNNWIVWLLAAGAALFAFKKLR
jgi:hypothetical protein